MTRQRKIKKKKNRIIPQEELDVIETSDRLMKYNKKKRQKRRFERRVNATQAFIRFICIIFLLWLASKILVLHYWFLPSDIFNKYPNQHFEIIGAKITPEEKIVNTLKPVLFENKPIYLINTSKYEKEIEKLSPVKKAFVRRYWLPAKLEVTIEEEIPLLTIAPNPNAPEIAAITADKKIITKDYLPINKSKYTVYKILTYDDYTKWSKQEISSLNILAERIEDYSQEKLIYIDIRNKNDVYAQLESTKVRIGELNSTLKKRIERLSSIMPQIQNLKRKIAYIDLRWENNTYLKQKMAKPVNIVPKFNQEKQNDNANKKVENKTTQTNKTTTETNFNQQKTKTQTQTPKVDRVVE